jgi:thiol-disulfide isomerase/thioredoxin
VTKTTFHIFAALVALSTLLLGSQVARADDWEREASKSARENADRGHDHHDHHTHEVADNRPPREKYAFDLPYADKDGSLSFDELCDSGKPFILVWWLSECPVCHMQMPYVQKLQGMIEEGKADMRIVSINIDFDTDECLEFCEERGISFEVLHDARGRRTDQGYRIDDMGTPATYIFKPGGELVDRISGWTGSYPEKILKMLDLEEKSETTANAAGRTNS